MTLSLQPDGYMGGTVNVTGQAVLVLAGQVNNPNGDFVLSGSSMHGDGHGPAGPGHQRHARQLVFERGSIGRAHSGRQFCGQALRLLGLGQRPSKSDWVGL